MLTEQRIHVDKLLLDPDNPRFIANLTPHQRTPDEEIEDKQAEIFRRFSKNQDDSEFDVTNIRDLYDSMVRIGFVGIDRIVVRALGEKYLVLEGNRRLATVKSILRDYQDMRPDLEGPEKRGHVESHLDSFRELPVMVLDTSELSNHEVYHKVSIILGIRHHGSVLEWEPLPKAYNIHTEYLEELAEIGEFRFENRIAKQVAERLCIKRSDVMSALRTYIVFLQVRERFPGVKDTHFSLIEAAVGNKNLISGLNLRSGPYLSLDSITFELDEPSLSKLSMICQFATRDSGDPQRTRDGKKKILKDPPACNILGRLIAKCRQAPHQSISEYGWNLVDRVENEDDLEVGLDQAINYLTAFEKRTTWVDAVGKLLMKQEQELSVEAYAGEGLDRGRKDQLEVTLEPLRKIMNI